MNVHSVVRAQLCREQLLGDRFELAWAAAARRE